MTPWRDIARSVIGGWEFSIRDYGQSALRRWRLSKSKVHLPANCYGYDLSIKHVDSDIAFHFSGYDAIKKFLHEKETRNPLGSDFPSYGSPLLSVSDRQYDSAYVGRVVIEKPGKEPKYVNPIWDDIDRKTLLKQISWNWVHEDIRSAPSTSTYRCSDGTLTLVNRKQLEKTDTRWSYTSYPLVNFMCRFYDNQSDLKKDRKSCCCFHLVIHKKDWFVYLYQFFSNYYGVKRTREMTMQCNFDDNVIYREIIERQPKDFEKKLCKDFEEEWEGWDNEMCVCFHEAKQLRIQDLQYGVQEGSKSPPVGSPTHFEALDFHGTVIDKLVIKCRDPFQQLEDEIKAPIQIIPLFRHPSYEKLSEIANGYEVPKRTPRKVCKLVSDFQA